MFNKTSDGEQWISISDLMSGLMMVFLFIAIAYMNNVEESKRSIQKVAVAYNETQVGLYNDLMSEFENDLPKWKAQIDKETLSVKFNEPEVLFRAGSANVSQKFKTILNDFFPRYLNIILSPKYQENIAEVRIEGHTSSEWGGNKVDKNTAYFLNMQLSQDRTRSVLEYCYLITPNDEKRSLIRSLVTANGLSSGRLVLDNNGKELKRHSRRVEFRTRTNAEQKIVEIIRHFE